MLKLVRLGQAPTTTSGGNHRHTSSNCGWIKLNHDPSNLMQSTDIMQYLLHKSPVIVAKLVHNKCPVNQVLSLIELEELEPLQVLAFEAAAHFAVTNLTLLTSDFYK